MTAKDYRLIAAALHRSKPESDDRSAEDRLHAWHHIANTCAHSLAADNPRFDFDRFIDACNGSLRGKR